MTVRPDIKPAMLRWARKRARIGASELAHKFGKLKAWESGEVIPTLRQLEQFANAVHVPVGYLFLPTPPEEALPIADFRTMAGRPLSRPSPNLLDTLYLCQERQAWYREFALTTQQPKRRFVGSATTAASAVKIARAMSQELGFNLTARMECTTWEEALRMFIRNADQAGALVMISGVVSTQNRRQLDPEEFRGFALADPHAPLVFINGADTKSGQMFTLAHELAHLWLGSSALSSAGTAPASAPTEEVWCNKVAAELLVPLDALRGALRQDEDPDNAMRRLARGFKVSTLVILRRLLDAQVLNRTDFDTKWQAESELLRNKMAGKGKSGGDFYRTTWSRAGLRFTSALVRSTLEGHTLYRDAFRMLGVAKAETLHKMEGKLEGRQRALEGRP